ncbi:MAG: hypothetical protein JWN43_4092 [Gammaproteobacteria bacterium]|nr:hypothetical protein [Gammaproteobacteria bacterium]
MSKETQKTRTDAGNGSGRSAPTRDAAPSPVRVTNNSSGRVKFDDRGNAVWEWAVTTGKFSVDLSSTSRLQKLENPSLSLAEDAPSPVDAVRPNPKGVAQGYSPYDSGLLAKPEPPRKKDLRRLSEWLKLRKQVSGNKQDED